MHKFRRDVDHKLRVLQNADKIESHPRTCSMLLQAFYSIRSERLPMERLEYDLLFRWFVGIGVDDPAYHYSRSFCLMWAF
jgi:transposase